MSILKNVFDVSHTSGSYNDNFTVVDIETSGFNPELHKIIEVAAIKVINGKPVDSYHSLLNYRGKLNPAISDLTSIDDNSLKCAPDRKSVLSEFFDFIGDYDLVGHNIMQFDNKFLWFSALSVGLTPKRNGLIDTLDMARATVLSDSYKLGYLCKELDISVDNTHRALDDAKLTLMLFEKITQQFHIGVEPKFMEYESSSPYAQKVDTKYLTKKRNISSRNIENKTFCITTFQPFGSFKSESGLMQFIVDADGKISNNLTQKTDYLIDCDPVYVSTKERKALEYIRQGKSRVKIIGPDQFLALANAVN